MIGAFLYIDKLRGGRPFILWNFKRLYPLPDCAGGCIKLISGVSSAFVVGNLLLTSTVLRIAVD